MSFESSWTRKATAAAPYVLAVAVAAFVGLNLTIGLHPDDVRIIHDARDASYGELWTSPFLDRFYRPLVVSLVKLSLDVFGDVAVPLRILHGVLVIAIIHTFVTMLRDRVGDLARHAAGLVLLASPLTFVSVSQFAVGIGDLIVGLMFLLALKTCLRKEGPVGVLVVFSVVALFSKESGLLVAAYCAFEALRRRQLVVCAIVCAAVASYLLFRTTFVARDSFEFSTGYFFDHYSIEQLDARFGDSRTGLYAYNVVANLVNVLVGFPERGQLDLPIRAAWLVPIVGLTTAISARYLTVRQEWKAKAPLVAIVLLNAALGYGYVRSRIMFVAAFAMAVVFLFAIDDLLARPQRPLGIDGRVLAAVVACLWLGVLVHSLVRLRLQAGAA